ncbi:MULTISPECIES: hypothetical protein [unclassified Plantactinospora]|uniref:hypothetical protein n=1 Tax=unclassified Plantactinospora TaxID=2631981 RepID=UPI000D161614|nr:MULTISPECIES: hypothetical protein [unclassified Plantactinospora]AVT28192.1 hypothetical protein C6361_00285 [Plantactinospora sp. BC1]AVT38572.1 hypothetical protein C6W10_21365 [Plantactinospora sp. BB1]
MTVIPPAPSSLNFLAGIFAGAGINLITSVSTGPEGEVSTAKIALDALLWVLAAAFLTWAAQVLEHGERDADLYIDRDFSDREKQDIREQYLRGAFRKARIPLVLTGIALVGAILLLPRFIQWGELL